ncbi:CDP-alcohol phosphatidyltransferase family protein [Oceanibaculum nanhaiense]|uniref:CDP-alcohol phosphatidyltransferase family protein n=1 Tax=Oceanibaculum nanhaiense TaxID=1909734 RepID=UPI000A3B7AA2|nr:CDP-alcohol phosphatidyltransferase family protein [Oceanibaculum nanhaiense]MBC7136422.1 CDP-alcohol phosphatidyltransferase family protein [Oceanibaculum nanhaiense]
MSILDGASRSVTPRLRWGTFLAVALMAAVLLALLIGQMAHPLRIAQSLLPFALIGGFLIRGLGYHAPHTRFGAANLVTLTRAAGVCLLAGFVGWADDAAALGWLLPLMAAALLALDGLDGWLARRFGLASAYGARFDMEVDGFLILVLALLVAEGTAAGPWVVLCGALRYLFLAWLALMPRYDRPLPPSLRRKSVFVVQAIALVGALVPGLPDIAAIALAALAAGLVSASFAIDSFGLYRTEKKEQTP